MCHRLPRGFERDAYASDPPKDGTERIRVRAFVSAIAVQVQSRLDKILQRKLNA